MIGEIWMLIFSIGCGYFLLDESVKTGPMPWIEGWGRWFWAGFTLFGATFYYLVAVMIALQIGLAR